MGVSDGSLHATEARATQAWIIQAPDGSEIKGMGPIDGDAKAKTIQHTELPGQTAIFLMLSLVIQYFRLFGGKIITYCDNQAVVQKLRSGWRMWRFRHTKGTDGDLQTVLRQTIQTLQEKQDFTYTTEWIKGHQDDDAAPCDLSRPATLNVQMDHDTKAAYGLPASWQPQGFIPVLPSERCAFYIDNSKLTANIHLSLQDRWHEKEARDYLLQRHNITTELFSTIHWQSLRFSLQKLNPYRRAIAVKAIYRHLPTQEKLFTQGRVTMSSLCPGCLSEPETNSHIYSCMEEAALKQRKDDWRELWKQLHQHHTASVIEQTWRYYLQPLVGIPLGDSIIDGLTIARGELIDLLQLAVTEQAAIGWDKLLLGMCSQAWRTVQDFIDSHNPKRPQRTATAWINIAVFHLLKFSLRCWKARNVTIHGSTKQECHHLALQAARQRITAIYEDPPTLAPQFGSNLAIPLEHRLKMPLTVAEQWLSMIAHQVRVTKHNFTLLLSQHKSIQSHLRTMRAVQAAIREMRTKLYAKKTARKKRPSNMHLSTQATPTEFGIF